MASASTMAAGGPFSAATVPEYLKSLSPAQLAAATHPAKGALSISAPPGSGKTRVLTSRVAWLVRERKIMPETIVVVTFTNKAATEMKVRLNKLIGPDRTARLVLGTFHATCARYLRKYAGLINLENNFSIMDAEDSRKVIREILKDLKDDLEAEGLKIKPEQVQGTISWSKAKDVSPAEYRANISRKSNKGYRGAHEEVSSYKAVVATVYEKYEKRLRDSNALDFDDLLVMGAKLLKLHPHVVEGVCHVLVDEMQDTNTTQYQLMSYFAHASKCITTVGDPDQAVYGWRAAEVGNLDRMRHEFKCDQALLEENYRSAGSILQAALALIEQDEKRVAKGLFTSHPAGPPVTLKQALQPTHEAAYVATEVKRLIAHSGGLLNYADFVILLRYNALSREVEQALQSENIPSRMVGGSKFFDRMEIKDILAYLTLAVNPTYTPAFVRVINVPKRGIGEKTIQEYLALAEEHKLTAMALAERVADGDEIFKGGKKKKVNTAASQVKTGMRKGICQLVGAVRELKKAASKGATVQRLIEIVLDNIDYKSHLQKEQDFESRLENIKELGNFSAMVAESSKALRGLGDLGTTASLARDFEYDSQERQEELSDSEEGPAIEVVPGIAAQATSSTSLHTSEAAVKEEAEEKVASSHRRRRPTTTTMAEGDDSAGQSGATAIEIRDSDSDDNAVVEARASTRKRARVSEETKTDDAIRLTRAVERHDEAANAGSDKEPDLGKALAEGTPLRTFLEACTLSTDTTSDEEAAKGPKVTISTCHAAKGLEYPIVFVMGVEDGIFPFYRCETEHEIAEERRLLYVAMTRAETMLYMTHCKQRMRMGQMDPKSLSQFLRPIAPISAGGSNIQASAKAVVFETARPTIDERALADIAAILDRPMPNAQQVQESIAEFEKTSTAMKIAQPEATGVNHFGGYGGGYGGYGDESPLIGHKYDPYDSQGGRPAEGFGRASGFGFGRSLSASSGYRRPFSTVSDSRVEGEASTSGFSTAASTLDSKSRHLLRNPSAPGTVGANGISSQLQRKRRAPNTSLHNRPLTQRSSAGLIHGESARDNQLPPPVAPSPRWIEDYKRNGIQSGSGSGTEFDASREGLMAKFASSSKASIDSLKSFLPSDTRGTAPSSGPSSTAFNRGAVGAAMPRTNIGSASSSSSSAPRPPAAFGSQQGGIKRLGSGGRSLGMMRRTPSTAPKK